MDTNLVIITVNCKVSNIKYFLIITSWSSILRQLYITECLRNYITSNNFQNKSKYQYPFNT